VIEDEDGIAGVKVLPHQKDFINSVNPTTGLVAGFGAGKSYAGTLKTIIKKHNIQRLRLLITCLTIH